MNVESRQSVSGYLAQDLELKRGRDDGAVLVAKLGQKHYRREADGTFTITGTDYVNLVMFGASAEASHERFRNGDDVVALGEFKPRTFESNGQRIEVTEFRAAKLLFDTTHPRYEVTRTPRQTPDVDRTPSSAPSPVPVPEDESETVAATVAMGR